jgi:hypothetical protein
MPEQRVLEDLLPRPDAGQGGVDNDELAERAGILSGEGIADHVADIVPQEIRPLGGSGHVP